ncbi:MAG TPA: hypothetical protein VIE64_06700 [Solirubrobacterales bacterium]
MRDPLLNEALKRLAGEAATRLSTLVASGDQIPFDVSEQPGPDSLFHSYVPLTAQYVYEREGELRALPAFEQAREAVEMAGVAAPYLEEHGEPVPAVGGERAARMLVTFIAQLWDGCAEFSLDHARLQSALAVLDAEVCDIDEADVLVAPLVGLQMSLARLMLPRAIQVVRADTFEAPIEAMRSEGMGREAWQPQFLAIAEQDGGPESGEAALRQLQDLISVMRMFKRGGIALGPYAFAPTGEGRWRRIATGAAGVRAGGYRLNAEEAEQLADFASTLEALPDPHGSLAWAVNRFELGCERETALRGLSDHLLALRAVLNGQGPVGASLPMRAAALIANESVDRIGASERVEKALELELAVMSGAEPAGSTGLALWVEDSLRSVLREATLGELGEDLGTAAEETLIAAGLDAGDAAIVGATSEWETPETTGEVEVTVAQPYEDREAEIRQHDDQETRILEPIPVADEIRITATPWLDEIEIEEDAGTLEWPAGGSGVEHRERIDTPRVRHLFPVPEDADWEVRELNYDHYRHAG